MTIKERVYRIIADKVDALPSDLRDDDLLEELGADSLDIIDIILECEHEFSIVIPEDVAHELKTVKDYVNHIDEVTKEHYHKYDKPIRIARKPVRMHEARNENWYQ